MSTSPRVLRRGKCGPRSPSWCAIGSHPSNDLIVDDPTVSRFHCDLAIASDRVRVKDLGSRNGTVAGGVAITDASIGGGTTLVLGHSQLRVEVDDGQAVLVGSERDSFGPLVGVSPQMRELFSLLERIAPTDATVLTEGETGTGKEGVAESIHEASPRAKERFVVLDCSAIAANLLESELFGHEAGSFTGTIDRRIGAFEEASKGTLFLDEIGEMPAERPRVLQRLRRRGYRPRVRARSRLRHSDAARRAVEHSVRDTRRSARRREER